MDIRVQETAFNAGDELNTFTQRQQGSGAVVSFTGIVRDVENILRHMEIEHYPSMTQTALETIAKDAQSRWALEDVLVIHRYGKLTPSEQIMMVATASAHRADAFAAADFLMDFLKSRAPFWKKEVTKHGEGWVDSKTSDEAALKRWDSR